MDKPVRRVAGRILVGPDDVRDEVWIVDGKLTFTRPSASDGVETVTGYALPGLVDAHCHVGLDGHGPVAPDVAVEQATTDRDSGALLLRDAGSPLDTRFLQERDDLPQIIRAGRHIARTRRYIKNYAHEIEPEDLVAYVRAEARRGDGWVKLVGDWIDRDDGDLGVCWPHDVLPEAVAAAHAEGARVTAHCFGEQSLRDLAAAGIDCIEHATGLREDSIDTFARQQIAIVPTLVNIENFPGYADAGEAKFPTYAAHMRDLYARRYDTVGAAHEAGVPIYVGTDAGGVMAHGLAAQEVAELVKAGLSPVEAISAATWGARSWLGRDGLVEGARADLVVYDVDPRDDVAALGAPRHVVLAGRVVR